MCSNKPSAVPFTVAADLDLGETAASWLRSSGADVSIRRGAVPDALPKTEAGGPAWQCANGRMLIKFPSGAGFLVEGDGVRYQTASETDAELRLFLFSGVWASLALLRGLLPLRASASSLDGAVHAFTGASGAGKSTLATALAAKGCPLFADDLVILDPASFGAEARCYAGPGKLQLWPAGAELAGATLGASVRSGVAKRFVVPRRLARFSAGRLKTLHVLSYWIRQPRREAPARIERLEGLKAVLAMYGALFRPRQALAVLGRRRLFGWLLAAAFRHVQVSVFHRPRLERRFNENVACLAATLQAH